MAKKPVKKVTKTVTHDRLSLSATYPTGGSFRFTVGRSGERLSWGGPDGSGRADMEKFMRVAAFLPGEKNETRFDRLKALAESVNSMAELIAKL